MTSNSTTELKSEFRKFFETEYPLNKDGLNELFGAFKEKTYPKGTRLLEVDEVDHTLRFLSDGIIREYYSGKNKEYNINFYLTPQFFTDLSSFTTDVPTKRNQETLTDVTVLVIGKESFSKLLEKYQCGKSFIDDSFKRLLRQKELFEFNRTTKTPEELYEELFIYKPHWLEKIPQYHIASFLEITPETLSRIRKRIS